MPHRPSACLLGRFRSAVAVILLTCEPALPALEVPARWGLLLPLVAEGCGCANERSCHDLHWNHYCYLIPELPCLDRARQHGGAMVVAI